MSACPSCGYCPACGRKDPVPTSTYPTSYSVFPYSVTTVATMPPGVAWTGPLRLVEPGDDPDMGVPAVVP